MNSIIKKELEKIRCELPEYDDNTTTIYIEKQGAHTNKFEVGNTYMVELANYILNEPANFTLSSNWNDGIVPTAKYMQITIKKIMGKMIQVDGEGYVTPDTIERKLYTNIWLPMGAITLVD